GNWRATMTSSDFPQTDPLKKSLQDTRSNFIRDEIPALPSMQPLAVDNLILMRSARQTWAVNFETGKRQWQTVQFDDPTTEQLLGLNSTTDNGRGDAQNNFALVERSWQDSTYGNLSTDGEKLYLIDKLDLPTGPMLNAQQMRGMGGFGRGGGFIGGP